MFTMETKIVPLDEKTYEDAVRLSVQGNTGQEKDIRPRLEKYKQYFVAIKDKKTVGVIGWYKDDGSFAGKALGEKFPHGKSIYWLSHFAVDRKYRNQGIGKSLLNYLESVLMFKKRGLRNTGKMC